MSRRFNNLLSAENLARLERERGACVVYTHFAKGFAVNVATGTNSTRVSRRS